MIHISRTITHIKSVCIICNIQNDLRSILKHFLKQCKPFCLSGCLRSSQLLFRSYSLIKKISHSRPYFEKAFLRKKIWNFWYFATKVSEKPHALVRNERGKLGCIEITIWSFFYRRPQPDFRLYANFQYFTMRISPE